MRVREVLLLLVACSFIARWGVSKPPPPSPEGAPSLAPTPVCSLLPEKRCQAPEPKWVAPQMPPLELPNIGLIGPIAGPTYQGVARERPSSISVNGISIGMRRSEVKTWLGPGRLTRSGLHFERYAVQVALVRDRVYAVEGTKLRFDGQVVLVTGDSKADAIQALGRVASFPEHEDLYPSNLPLVVRLKHGVVTRIVLGSRC